MAALVKRYVCDQYGNCTYTNWDIWIRWVVLVIVIVLFLLAFFLCSCSNARRRRRQGLAPYYGTGWATRPFYRNDPYYNRNYPPPLPQYSANVPEGHQPYYGQSNGIELQQPLPSYAPGRSTEHDVYQEMERPPPTKAIVR